MAMTSNLVILQILLFLFRRKYQHVLEISLEGGPVFKEIMFPRNYAHFYLTTRTNAKKGWAYFRGTTVCVNNVCLLFTFDCLSLIR